MLAGRFCGCSFTRRYERFRILDLTGSVVLGLYMFYDAVFTSISLALACGVYALEQLAFCLVVQGFGRLLLNLKNPVAKSIAMIVVGHRTCLAAIYYCRVSVLQSRKCNLMTPGGREERRWRRKRPRCAER